MRTTVLFLLWFLTSFHACLAAQDFLNAGQKITGSKGGLVSHGQRFALGFFSPPGSPTESYLGIWYCQSQDSESRTLVWVANRDNPVLGSNVGVFQIAQDGNLVVTDASGERYYWFSKLEGSSSTNRTVKLMDSGNLVLLQDSYMGIWQSFQHPTDTFLPGMKMDTDLKLTSWRNDSDPRSGNFTFKMSQTGDNPYIILNNHKLHWEGGKMGELNSGSEFDYVIYLLSNFSLSSTSPARRNKRPGIPMDYENTRLLMNSTGELQFLTRDSFQGDWSIAWKAPASICDSLDACGKFSSCNDKNNAPCKCLPGFSLDSERECARKSASSCGEGTTRFLTLVMVKMGNPDIQYDNTTKESDCRSICQDLCPHCQAYSYAEPIYRNRRFSRCWVWTQDLGALQEGYLDDNYGRNLSVRVDISDIAPTPRTCEPCGTNIIPYPLSTGPNCGDPIYSMFSCKSSTGQLSFTTTSGDSHAVVHMDVDSRRFTFQVDAKSFTYCSNKFRNSETLHISFPFNVTNACSGQGQVEVAWQPPAEPICKESVECEGWKHSSCKIISDGIKRCLCDTNYHWDGVSLNCTNKEAITVPAPSKEPRASEGSSKGQTSLILGITLTSVVLLACAIIFAYLCRRKITRKKDKESIKRNRGRFYDSERHVKDLIEVEGFEEKGNEGIEVPYFDFENILQATDNFSDANKLGRGGYGPVYKGTLQSGEVVAVKRLSTVSSQGLQEFKNEVVLIAKLQHRNLVRLRGYCIEGDEKILLYEYMQNKSLDSFIFDPTQSLLLDWQMRFDIILGVARGILYLHHDSRLRVIHRDLKIGNILLDGEMQPKISDFGLARIVTGKETEANTEKIVGTYGYMSPEYALNGFFSTKSDVFSFGVVLLEIISGKKNTGFYHSDQVLSLLSYAWRLWTENRLLHLMDISLSESCNANQFIRCAHIGLLCVQDEPSDRPTMSNVVTLLDNETSPLPTPKQPTVFARKGLPTTSSSKSEISLQFESGTQEGR